MGCRRRLVLILVLVLSVLAGCARPAAAPPAPSGTAPGATQVKVVQPTRQSLKQFVEQPGAVHPYEEAPLFAKMPGFVHKVHVDIGQRVRGPQVDDQGKETKPGDLLAEIALPELVEEGKQKQELVKQADVEVELARKVEVTHQANVAAVEAVVVESQAALKRAQALYERWASETKRVSRLVGNKVLDEQTGDETINQFRASEAAREEARARVLSMEAAVRKARAERDKAAVDIRVAEAKAAVARAEARRLEALLQYTKIRAPFDGVVTKRKVDTGHFLQPSMGKIDSIFTVTRLDPVRIVVDVPETEASLVADSAEVSLVFQALAGTTIQGKVTRTAWSLDPGARTLRTEIDLPNPDGRLRPGMYLLARITTHRPIMWALPATALVKQGDAMVAFRIEKNKAIRTPIRIGRTDGKSTEILKMERDGTWQDLTGQENFAVKATGLSDGEAVENAE